MIKKKYYTLIILKLGILLISGASYADANPWVGLTFSGEPCEGVSRKGLKVPPECRFQKIIGLAPRDPVGYMLYANFLKNKKHFQDADMYYKKAIELEPTNFLFKYSHQEFLVEKQKHDAVVGRANEIKKAQLLNHERLNARAGFAPWVGSTFTGILCEGGHIHYGPFDYTSAARRENQLPIVEAYHFTKEVQTLKKGKSGTLLGDLDYTLGAFPNHHKALNSLTYFTLLNKPDIEIITPLECYFQRAINFAPKDVISYMLYASYLKKARHIEEADKIYKKAIKIAAADLSVRYSYGLFLLDLKKYAEASEQAEIVYEKNYPKQKLKQQLMASGYWKK